MANSAAIGRAIREKISATVRDVMLAARENVADATPVDTHHAESNWVLSVGSPYTGIDGSRKAVSFAAQQAGDARMKAYDVGRDGPAYLRNNVGYIKFLNKGSSLQAPPRFVETAITGARSVAARGMKTRVGKLLRKLAKAAYRRGERP